MSSNALGCLHHKNNFDQIARLAKQQGKSGVVLEPAGHAVTKYRDLAVDTEGSEGNLSKFNHKSFKPHKCPLHSAALD